MMSSANEVRALQNVAMLEPAVAQLEQRLAELASAITRKDSAAIENAAAGLHKALASAIHDFQRAAREGGVPPQLRRRLIVASGQVAALREAMARASASLDRALDALLPGQALPVYGQQGQALRQSYGGAQA